MFFTLGFHLLRASARRWRPSACSGCSLLPSASSPRCMAAASPPIPAYLADIFGTQFVGAIHGRLLTAWSTAGIVGPVIVNYMHDNRKAAGIAPDQIYHPIFYVLAGLLVAGFIANLLIRPLDKKWFMKDEEVKALQAAEARAAAAAAGVKTVSAKAGGGVDVTAILAWAAVGIPLAWGIWITLAKALVLFQ